jgi:hypothetical protein
MVGFTWVRSIARRLTGLCGYSAADVDISHEAASSPLVYDLPRVGLQFVLLL